MEIKQLAFGLLGLTPREFNRMSVSDFRATQRGFFEKMKIEARLQWETARFISYHSLLPYQKKGKRLKITDIARFEWEQTNEVPELTEKQKQALEKMGDKY